MGDLSSASPQQKRQALERLIQETLLRQRIAELGLQASEEEVEAAIRDVQRQNNLTREQLEQALVAQGMSFAEYRESLREQILRFKLIGREVQSRVEVTNAEIRDYFRENIDRYRQEPKVRLSRLTFSLPKGASEEQEQEVRRRAEEARLRLASGESFEAVLKSYREEEDVSGGDMGTFEPGDLTEPFAQAVRGKKEGEVSEPVAFSGGVHILQVSESRPGQVQQFDAVQEEIVGILKERKSEQTMREWAEELREKAYIDVRI